MSRADEICRSVTRAGVAPLAAAACAVRRGGAWRTELGGDTSTLFDLASLTKPMTAVAVARSALSRGEALSAVLPELSSTRSAAMSIERLLAHRAGLVAHIPLFEAILAGEMDHAAALVVAANARRDDLPSAPGDDGYPPVYSDLGYVLAGAALARRESARDAGEAIARLVVEPLALDAELGTARELAARGIDVVARAAPTELVPWRGGEVRGVVHDENAWTLTGLGGSGHAGMFGTVRGVLAFACAFEDALRRGEGALSACAGPGGARERRIDFAWLVVPRDGGTLRAGFDGKSAEGSSAGARFGARAFGHLGFTGTSLWIDPDAEVVAVLLTNRVHPSRDNVAIRAARPAAHDALFERAMEL